VIWEQKGGKKMSLGKVHVWKMSEEERLAYIEKYPIVPTEKPKGAGLSAITDMQYEKSQKNRYQGKGIMDSVDKDHLHKMFMAGETLDVIAKNLKISDSTLNNFLNKQRKLEPEKWPYRDRGRK
jgi:hypothetical protein